MVCEMKHGAALLTQSFPPKRKWGRITAVMSLLDVGAHVKLQFEGLGESFSTHVTRARPLFGMGASHVTVMCCV